MMSFLCYHLASHQPLPRQVAAAAELLVRQSHGGGAESPGSVGRAFQPGHAVAPPFPILSFKGQDEVAEETSGPDAATSLRPRPNTFSPGQDDSGLPEDKAEHRHKNKVSGGTRPYGSVNEHIHHLDMFRSSPKNSSKMSSLNNN